MVHVVLISDAQNCNSVCLVSELIHNQELKEKKKGANILKLKCYSIYKHGFL